MSKKVLIILASVFFVILIVELIYLFNLSKNNKINSQSDADFPTPTTLVRRGTQAIPDSNLDYLFNLNKEIVISSTIKNTYYGTITKISTKPGQWGNNKYLVTLELTGDKINKVTFYYNRQEVEKVKISDYLPDQTSLPALSFNDLKVGDEVVINEEIDMLEDINNDSFINLEIIRQ